MVETVNEGQVAVRSDIQLTDRVTDRARTSGEEFLPGFTLIISPGVSQWWIEID